MSEISRSTAARTDGPPVAVPCPVLVGRSSELQTLVAALDSARAGEGSVVFVVGEAGIGKSRLVQEVAAVAIQERMRVLRGRAVPGSHATAFRPLAEAFAPVADDAAANPGLASWLPALGAIVPTLAPAGATEVSPPVRGEAVLRLLATVGASGGGVLVVEDLHWADPETVALVEHLSDNLQRAPVACVVTVRDEDSPARELVTRVRSRRTATVLHLERLNAAQVAAMVYSCTGGRDAADVERAVSMADGVPFLVEEMLVSPGLPATFADGVHARLAELSDTDRRVLVSAAAYGRHFDWRLLAAAADVDDAAVVDALERGVVAQLLSVEGDGFRFRHALTSEAVFQSVTPPRREASAAAALEALDGASHAQVDRREVAARLAERAGHRARAGTLQIELGDEALRRGALHTAIAALRRAIDLLPPGDEQDVAGERLVEALALAGRVDDALAVGDELVDRLPNDRAATVQLRLADAATRAARWPVARDRLAAARSLLGTDDDPQRRAQLAVREAEVALGTNEPGRAEELAHLALDVAGESTSPELACEALQLLGRCARRSSLPAAERWFREALQVAEANDLPLWRLRALHEVGTIALLERSEVDALLEAQQLAESVGAMATAAVLDIEIAAGHAGADDLDGAREHGERAIRRATELGLGLIAAWGWQHVAAVAALRRDDEHAAAARSAALAAAPGDGDIAGFVVGTELFAALARDELDAALELAARMTDLLRGSETAAPAHHRAAWPLLLALRGAPEAASVLDELERSGIAVNRGARGWLLLARAVLAGRADGQQAAALAAEADAELVHMPMWQSLGRRLAAEAAAADGWTIPAGWLTEAEACLRRLGLFAAADSCRRLRGARSDGLPAAWSRLGITRRESEVLTLVIEGLSNREIAERLYLSARTVEKHIESLLRKTATRTRTQLARAASTA